MASSAYIEGALDALVKAGEISPAYAEGIYDELCKQAGIFVDSPMENYWQQVQDYADAHPGRVQGDNFQISPDEATKLVDRSRHWWSNLGGRTATYLGNRARKAFRWWPGNNMTGEMYDRELADAQNRERHEYMQKELMSNGITINPQVAAAVQDKHVNDARMRMADARRTMSQAQMEAKGLTRNYPESFRTRLGNSAIAGKMYQPVYDRQNVQPKKPTAYGMGIPDSYGANKGLFYANPYKHM